MVRTDEWWKVGRRTQAYVHDLVMTVLALVLTVAMVEGADGLELLLSEYAAAVALMFLVFAAILLNVGLYRGIWRFASAPDLVSLVRASLLITLVLAGFCAVLVVGSPLTPETVATFFFIHLVFLGGPRFAYRLIKDSRTRRRVAAQPGGTERVLVCGADSSAAGFIRAIQGDPRAEYDVVGIVDPLMLHRGRRLHGVPILGTLDDLPRIVSKLALQGRRPVRLAITAGMQKSSSMPVRRIIDLAESQGLATAQIPNFMQLQDAAGGRRRVSLRPIPIEDLLGRPQVALDEIGVHDFTHGRCVLVTGAGGTIGGELSRQLASFGPSRLVLLDAGEFNLYQIERDIRAMNPTFQVQAVLCDVRDRQAVLRTFRCFQPEVVVHAAALKHVPLVETNPAEGVLTNVIGTRHVADACRATGVTTMVMISTDKAIRPTNVMGATKRIAELYCQASDLVERSSQSTPTRFVTVRFGNVLGSSGSVVPLFQQQLEAGGPLTVTHPQMRRYFMTVREAVQLVLQAAVYGVRHPEDRGRIFVLDMGEPMLIVDLARQMIRLAGLQPDVDIGIEFVGLRPGEKLFEELFDPDEHPERTQAEGIFVASPRIIDFQILTRALDEIEAASRAGDTARINVILSNLVPGFSPVVKMPPAATSLLPQD